MQNRKCTVLIVDDTLEDRLTCRRFLNSDTEWQYAFLEADMGELGIALCQESRPDCVLLDYQLPDMDGLEVLSSLTNEKGELPFPVVMMTGTDEVKIAVEAMKLGAQDFINKNRLTPLDLRRAVHNAIERVELQREARENEHRFRTLTEAIPQLVWTCASDGSCDYLSSRWLQYTGTNLEENLGHGWLGIIHPDDLSRSQELWAQAVAAGKAYEVELRLRRADGVYRWHLARSLPITNMASQSVKWFGTCTDIEERKKAEREREQSLEREQLLRTQAEQANRLKDEFLATISHELRTPLSNSYGWVRMMRLGQVPLKDAAHALEIVERNMQAQNNLIEDLLDVSRIITGKMRLDVRPVEFSDVIERAINAAQPAAVAKGVNLQVVIAPGSNMVSGDPDRLQQIAWNLISNAIKFTSRGGHVQVCVERVKTNIYLVVSDTGEGIAPEFLHHVFERFTQQDGTKSRRHGGLGLGLAIVRHLVELHGGKVSVESDGVGKGATFRVELPLVVSRSETEGNAQESKNENALDGLPSLNGVRVLAVDDDPDALSLIKAIFEPTEVEIRTAPAMAEALEILSAWQPDVLVSDIGMPNGDGYELIRRIRQKVDEQLNQVPAVALTAYASKHDRMLALASGFQMHLVKPIDPSELITVVASLTGRLGARQSMGT